MAARQQRSNPEVGYVCRKCQRSKQGLSLGINPIEQAGTSSRAERVSSSMTDEVYRRCRSLHRADLAGTLVNGSSSLNACLKAFVLSCLLDCVTSSENVPAMQALLKHYRLTVGAC